ncbi:MAG: hypothetical protein JWM12_1855 [Ilumatobacteraceae bacterium]|nr:hypothetical protein [Ilumatobacteraceae bacterium]
MSDRGRILLIAAVVLIVGLILSARFFAGFYVDYLWHTSLGRGDVFWGVLRTKILLFVLFAGAFIAMAVLNLLISDRLSPVSFSANTHPAVERFHEFFGKRLRLFRIAVAVVLGLLFAAPAIGRWQEWLMFRNSKAFGISDAQFHHDIGFYLFKLPFITFLLDWLFAALIVITLLTIATHVLNGGIIVQPPRPKVRNAAKAHVAVLLAALALVKAGDYWVQRYSLTAENRAGSIVRGATYTEVHAHLPAIVLLGLVAVLTAGLFLSTLKTGSWRVPIIASALWAVMALVGGIIYPATIQALVVNPNQREREAPYIERNVLATRHALGIDDVQKVDTTVGSIDTQQVEDGSSSLQNVRLLKSDAEMVSRYRSDEGLRAGLTIKDLDIDRYVIDGREQQVVLGARELDLSAVANKSWQGQHLISTHGCGLVLAPAGQTDTNGRPVYQDAVLDRPELYFSEDVGGYAIVDSKVNEETCPNQADPGPYAGTGGVKLDSTVKRLAFALDYLDYNLIGSSAVNDNSRLIATRRVQDRVRSLAPFLQFDGDPYPVALGGRVLWVVDGYTTSDLYPYGENGDRSQLDASSGLSKPFNYVRNSVKAVVDAYDGTTTFYAVDTIDPVLKVWESAFPNLFQPMSDMPAGLTDHLRYPEELFRIQTAAYSKYQLAPDQFFDRIGAWSVAQAPPAQAEATSTVGAPTTDAAANQQQAFSDESASARFVPYYSMFKAPNQSAASFQLFRPYVKFSTNDDRRELQAYMTASSDPATYGTLTAYTVAEPLPNGPLQVANTMAQDPSISEQVTLIDQRGSQVVLGDLQMVPIDGGVVWIRPMFSEPATGSQPLMKFVLASYNGQAAYGVDIGEAIGKLFPGFNKDLGDRVDVGNEPPGSGSGTSPPDNGSTPSSTVPGTTQPGSPTTTPSSTADSPEAVLAEADQLFAEADAALKAGDLGTYQAKVTAARALVTQAHDMIVNATAPSSSTPAGTTATSSPTSTPASSTPGSGSAPLSSATTPGSATTIASTTAPAS